jgi:cytochrome c peroxidase
MVAFIFGRKHLLRKIMMITLFLIACVSTSCSGQRGLSLDDQLAQVIRTQELAPPAAIPMQDPAMVELGRSLFFEKELSGNRDISCATCHHPFASTGDGLSLSIGTGGVGIATTRVLAREHEFIPRNAPDVFNRGDPLWETMFWDIRVSGSAEKGFISPAGGQLPDGLENALAVQAMFPPTSQAEMRGFPGDLDVYGIRNELAEIEKDNFPEIWDALMARLLSIPEYVSLFGAAYPAVPIQNLGFEHAANAIAAFEMEAFTFVDSPWDLYLSGDSGALSDNAKRGAILFYGEAGCGACHAGTLMTDQRPHNMAVPQLGPGKGDGPFGDLDQGRARETGAESEMYAFRTPSLRNVALTGPWMHNGAFVDLESAVRHMLRPEESLRAYDPGVLSDELASTCKTDMAEEILRTLDPMAYPVDLSESQFSDLMAFLHALTSPSALDLRNIVPTRIPSGIPLGN